jgi:LPS-assembly lipoprotein
MRKIFGALALFAVFGASAVSLSSCGFVPLYAKAGLTANLAQIDIKVPQTRTGYFLEQDLNNGLGINESTPKTYKLVITMKERHYSVGYKVDDTSTRSEITSNVTYVLRNMATKQVLYRNSFSETITYDTSKSPFAGIISQQDGQRRIATGISEHIQRDLALYFHGDLLTAKPSKSRKTSDESADSSSAQSDGSADSSSSLEPDTVKETEITPAEQ